MNALLTTVKFDAHLMLGHPIHSQWPIRHVKIIYGWSFWRQKYSPANRGGINLIQLKQLFWPLPSNDLMLAMGKASEVATPAMSTLAIVRCGTGSLFTASLVLPSTHHLMAWPHYHCDIVGCDITIWLLCQHYGDVWVRPHPMIYFWGLIRGTSIACNDNTCWCWKEHL